MQTIQNLIISITDGRWYILYCLVLALSIILYFISSRVILRGISLFFQKTSTQFDDILLEKRVFNRLPLLIPLIFIYNFKNILSLPDIFDRVLFSVIAVILISFFNAFFERIK